MTGTGPRIVAAADALKPLGLSLIVGRDEFVITDKPDDLGETSIHYPTIERVEEWIADHRPTGAAQVKPLRYPPDTVAGWDSEAGGYRAGTDVLIATELPCRGFVRSSYAAIDGPWVQADGFQVRGLFRRGDAQRFTAAELRDHVEAFFTERGVVIEKPDAFEAFCFNYEPGINLEKASEQAAADMAAVAAPTGLIEQREPRVTDPVHYVSHGSPVRPDGTQAYTSQCRAAIVTEPPKTIRIFDPVHGTDEYLAASLFVINPTGTFHNQDVRYDSGTFTGPEREAAAGKPLPQVTCDDLSFEGGTWHWPGDQ